MLPKSLFGRLLAISAVTTLLALILAGAAIGGILDRFATGTVDQRLTDKLFALGGVVRPDGSLDRAAIDRFIAHGATDADWRVEAPGGVVGSAQIDGLPGMSFAGDQTLGTIPRGPELHAFRHHPRRDPASAIDAPYPFEAHLADGTRVHGRADRVPTDAGDALIAVAVPRDMIERPVRAALVPLAWSLLVLGVALAVGNVLQLRLGLRPLQRLRDQVAGVRSGTRAGIDEDQPAELRPLALELNALIAQNAAGLAHARRHVANLAHGLKTPIAAIGVRLGEPGRDPDGSLAAMLFDVDARIRHHLGRARAASPGETSGRAVPLAPAIDDLVAVLARIHGRRTVTLDVPADLAAVIDPQDLDELAGNLLDNAWRHAAAAIRVTAHAQGAMLALAIEDDGPGLTDDQLTEARLPGRRLDESRDGHGFGLPIAEEIAELNGGGIALDRSERLGGLRVRVTLPRAATRSA